MNISTVYFSAIYGVSVWHCYHIMSQRYGNCLTSKNVRRELLWSWLCETAWMETGLKLLFADKFTRLCLSNQIHIQWGCANDVGDFSEKTRTWCLKCPSDQLWNWYYVTHWHEECTELSRHVFATMLKLWTETCYLHVSCISYICIYTYIYIYKSTTKQNNIRHSTYITLFNSRRFEYKLFFRLRQSNDWKTIRWVKFTYEKMRQIYKYMYIYTYIHIYIYVCIYVHIYIYIYNKFTEASHHNTLNIAQSRWM